jgi:exonuclease VII large subunit
MRRSHSAIARSAARRVLQEYCRPFKAFATSVRESLSLEGRKRPQLQDSEVTLDAALKTAAREADAIREQTRRALEDEVKNLLEEARRDAEATKSAIIAEAREAALNEHNRSIEQINKALTEAMAKLDLRSEENLQIAFEHAVRAAGRDEREYFSPPLLRFSAEGLDDLDWAEVTAAVNRSEVGLSPSMDLLNALERQIKAMSESRKNDVDFGYVRMNGLELFQERSATAGTWIEIRSYRVEAEEYQNEAVRTRALAFAREAKVMLGEKGAKLLLEYRKGQLGNQ